MKLIKKRKKLFETFENSISDVESLIEYDKNDSLYYILKNSYKTLVKVNIELLGKIIEEMDSHNDNITDKLLYIMSLSKKCNLTFDKFAENEADKLVVSYKKNDINKSVEEYNVSFIGKVSSPTSIKYNFTISW